MMASKPNPRAAAVEKFVQDLSEDVREQVQKLRDVQERCDLVKQKFLNERKKLEEKYRLEFDPLYTERAKIIAGSEDHSESCVKEPCPVPEFWLRVLKNGDMVGENISKRDEPILKYLLDIRHEPIEDNKPGFKLVFKFADNPYFTPSTLEKKYFMGGEDESQLEDTVGTDIHWKEGKNPSVRIVQKHGQSGDPPEDKTVHKHSFFDFFASPPLPQTDNQEEIADIVELLAEDDLELGCCIKEMLLPSAVSWYTGEIGVDAFIEGDEGSSSSDDNSDNNAASYED